MEHARRAGYARVLYKTTIHAGCEVLEWASAKCRGVHHLRLFTFVRANTCMAIARSQVWHRKCAAYRVGAREV